MIVLWSGIISHGRNKLLELTGKSHSEELWSPVRCAFIGALTLYYYFIGFFGILAAIAITLVWQGIRGFSLAVNAHTKELNYTSHRRFIFRPQLLRTAFQYQIANQRQQQRDKVIQHTVSE